jgi:ElaB/YqjD/DUF883 family membrane-anchored ribosome-binding protein
MTTPDPDRLRSEIEYTQRNLSTDVDLLAEKVTPGRIVRRRTERARRAVTGLRDRVMGSAADTKDSASTAASSVADRASSVADDAARTAREAPQAIRRGTEGNPIAAGLIAFGAGWLLSTLAPPSRPEQELAAQATDWAREHSGPVQEELGQLARDMRDPAQQAVDSVRETATDAADTVKDDARAAAGDVGDRAERARSSVQDNRS